MFDQSARRELERIILQAAGTGLSWAAKRPELILDEKSAGQFASNADIEIEEQIRRELTRAFPGEPILGEEGGGALDAGTRGWVVDPIDGTSNFIVGLPLWGVSIGYIEAGASVLGAIALPDAGLTISAARGAGVSVNGEALGAASRSAAVKVIALGENDYESGPETDARAQVLRREGYSVVRYRCAVFALGFSAIGRLGGYVEHGCGLWDIAAADIICREAGMTVNTAKIEDSRYSIDARLR